MEKERKFFCALFIKMAVFRMRTRQTTFEEPLIKSGTQLTERNVPMAQEKAQVILDVLY